MGRIIGSDVTKISSSLVDPGGRLGVIGNDVLDGVVNIDEVLGEITKLQAHERLLKTHVGLEEIKLTDDQETDLGGAGSYCGNKSENIEYNLCNSGESGGGEV